MLIVFPANQLFAMEHQVSVMSDYLSDGVSETNSNPALQWQLTGNIDEIYTNAFVSNLQYDNDKGWEFDVGIGKIVEFSEFRLDIGMLNNLNFYFDNVDKYFLEVYSGFLFTEYTSFYFTYADDRATFDGGKNAKVNFDQVFELDENWLASYQLGYTDMYRSKLSNSDYFWWQLGLIFDNKKYSVKLAYDDTDIKLRNDPRKISQQNLSLIFNYIF